MFSRGFLSGQSREVAATHASTARKKILLQNPLSSFSESLNLVFKGVGSPLSPPWADRRPCRRRRPCPPPKARPWPWPGRPPLCLTPVAPSELCRWAALPATWRQIHSSRFPRCVIISAHVQSAHDDGDPQESRTLPQPASRPRPVPCPVPHPQTLNARLSGDLEQADHVRDSRAFLSAEDDAELRLLRQRTPPAGRAAAMFSSEAWNPSSPGRCAAASPAPNQRRRA